MKSVRKPAVQSDHGSPDREDTLMKYGLGLAGLALLVAHPAAAQSYATSAGKRVKVYVSFDCVKHRPRLVSYTANNGSLETVSSTADKCGNASEPVVELWYTPKAGFRGTDEVFITGGGRNRITVRVN
jgi:hypothetical protein